MCKRALVAALLIGVAGASSSAQRAASADERARRVDTLVAHWRRAKAVLAAHDDSIARTRLRMDTLRVGSIRIFVQQSLRARTEAAARVAYAYLDSVAGPAASRMERKWLVVRQLRDSTPDSLVVAAVDGLKGHEFLQVWGSPDDELLATWIRSDAMSLIAADVGPQFRAWLPAALLLPDTLNTESWTTARLNLVSSFASVARRCYDGDLRACAVTLGLVDVADPVTEWYDAAGRRRHMVAVLKERESESRGAQPDEERCAAGDDPACVRAMHAWLGTRACFDCTAGLYTPFPTGQRMTLAKLAIQMGGRAGYERILNATGTPAERIAAAAGVPIDSVLSAWHAKVRGTRLPSEAFSVQIAATSLLWILACGALSLRSSRWR